jgi:SnoaL-like domain
MELLGAIAAGDREAIAAMVSDGVVYHSPGTTYSGRDQVVDVLGAAPSVIANLRATGDQIAIGDDEGLTFVTGAVEEEQIHGVLIEARNEAGRVAEITLLLRPLSAVQAATRHLARALADAGESRA